MEKCAVGDKSHILDIISSDFAIETVLVIVVRLQHCMAKQIPVLHHMPEKLYIQ